jgi:hypothetical protein
MRKIFIALVLTFALFASASAQVGVSGPTTIYEGEISVWYPTVTPPGTQYVRMTANNIRDGVITWPENLYQFDEYRMTPSGTGKFLICAQAEPSNEFIYFGWVYVVENPTPPHPVPSISGPSTAYEGSTASYSMPSGKQAYEWILPYYGVSHVQQYNNIKVVYFQNVPGSGQQRTIQGRYKENGYWSEYGSKTTTVY